MFKKKIPFVNDHIIFTIGSFPEILLQNILVFFNKFCFVHIYVLAFWLVFMFHAHVIFTYLLYMKGNVELLNLISCIFQLTFEETKFSK